VVLVLGYLNLGCDTSSLGNVPVTQGGGVTPAPAQAPFAVGGDLDGLMIGWLDAEGLHTATKRSDVPEHRRAQVRIDSLDVAPDQRLDPTLVYVADIRAALPDGSYPVRTMERAAFDALFDKTAGVVVHVPAATDDSNDPSSAPADATKPVVIYMASWCGACKGAAAYLRQRGVEFTERDVERDPGAQAEMQQKAHAAGRTPRGVPVIDFRGTILLGFDKQRLAQLIDRTTI
jgi:glutaredoxin